MARPTRLHAAENRSPIHPRRSSACDFRPNVNKCILSGTFGQPGIAIPPSDSRNFFLTPIARGPMKRTLPPEAFHEVAMRLELAHKAFQRRYPGASGERQPVHVVYGGAHLFRSGTTRKLGDLALRSLDDFAPDFVVFAKAIGLSGSDRIPDSPEAAASIAKSIISDPDAARRENQPAWFAHTVYGR